MREKPKVVFPTQHVPGQPDPPRLMRFRDHDSFDKQAVASDRQQRLRLLEEVIMILEKRGPSGSLFSGLNAPDLQRRFKAIRGKLHGVRPDEWDDGAGARPEAGSP